MNLALIMLAAGNSRRFGSNKLLYEIEGKPMYRHILENLAAVAQKNCADSWQEAGQRKEDSEPDGSMKEYEIKKNRTVTVVTQYEEIGQEARKLGAKVYYNPHPEEGISSSMKIGLKANLDADACLFTVSDQPWLTTKTIEDLIGLLESTGKGIACVSCDGKLGNPCIFTEKYYEELLLISGDRGGKSVIRLHREDTAVLKVEDQKELMDMDVMHI